MEEELSENHAGELKNESAESKGERIIDEELQRLGWRKSDLTLRLQGDPARMAIASRPRSEIMLTVDRRTALLGHRQKRARTCETGRARGPRQRQNPLPKFKQTEAHKPDNVALL